MQVKACKKGITIETVSDLNLKQTLTCGQCFRWEEQCGGTFTGTAFGKTVTVDMRGDTLLIAGASISEASSIWADYFDLHRDYALIREELSCIHPVLREAARFAPGIRILNQEPWEALCSFIISQNNNIPRIKGIITRLCESFGEERDGSFLFPTAQKMAQLTPDDLAPLRSGFRAKYLTDAAGKVASGEINLKAVQKLQIADARQELMKIKGVGPKVADCTLLYGMHRLDCFPLDVWMKRAMDALFPDLEPEDFGQYAGIAQQYIFHYSRMHPSLFE